jgi:hypothetical protein
MLAYLDTLIGFAVVMLGASLLITILTQMISSLLSHRGANLRWGLETMFQHVTDCPQVNANAKILAARVLTHPLISDSIFSNMLRLPIPKWFSDRWKLATAIGPNELVGILHDLSKDADITAIHADLAQEITSLVNAPSLVAGRKVALLTGAAAAVVGGAPPPHGPTVADALAAASPLVAPLLQDTVKSIEESAGKLEAWFEATMGRVSQRFTTYAQLWTVAFSVALAGYTGLNSVTLLNQLYTNGAFRQQLVGAAPQLSEVAERVLPDAAKSPAVQTSLTQMYTDAVTNAVKAAGATADATASGLQTEPAAEAWITAHVKDPNQQTATQNAFAKAMNEQRLKDATAVRTILTNASFDITQFRWKQDQPYLPQIPGVLATAALLSMGAPFWFNALKSLTNLRPIVANKQSPPASK